MPTVRPLSPRQREVLDLLGDGLTNRQIAERLEITPETAGTYVQNVFRKLGLHNRQDAAEYARANREAEAAQKDDERTK